VVYYCSAVYTKDIRSANGQRLLSCRTYKGVPVSNSESQARKTEVRRIGQASMTGRAVTGCVWEEIAYELEWNR